MKTTPISYLGLTIAAFSVLSVAFLPLRNARNGECLALDTAEKQKDPSGEPQHQLRIAVVDISAVFDKYGKKQDRQRQLQAGLEEVKAELELLQTRYKTLTKELEALEADSAEHKEKSQSLEELKRQVNAVKEKATKELKRKQAKALQEIRDEITAEIRVFATERKLDLVLERTVSLSNPSGPDFQWPIVHFADKKHNITELIANRLNEKYRKD